MSPLRKPLRDKTRDRSAAIRGRGAADIRVEADGDPGHAVRGWGRKSPTTWSSAATFAAAAASSAALISRAASPGSAKCSTSMSRTPGGTPRQRCVVPRSALVTRMSDREAERRHARSVFAVRTALASQTAAGQGQGISFCRTCGGSHCRCRSCRRSTHQDCRICGAIRRRCRTARRSSCCCHACPEPGLP